MSNSLDKLKALTYRLDDRLARKREELKTHHDSHESDRSSSTQERRSVNEVVDLINASQASIFDVERSKISDQNFPKKSENTIFDDPPEKINILDDLSEFMSSEVDKLSIDKKSDVVDNRSDITVLIKAEEAENIRENNIKRVKELYESLEIYDKSPDFDNIFMYKAMNLSGIGLKDDDFGIIRKGKYIQIIAITYEPDASGKKKAKNISLGYFGKGDTIDPQLKNDIIEFVLCWRYEKAFQNVEHYKNLLTRVEKQLKEETILL